MSLSMNPLLGRPWSCSVFGRPLVNSIIDNLIKENDIQSACMVISKLKLHDLNIKTDLNDENVTINGKLKNLNLNLTILPGSKSN